MVLAAWKTGNSCPDNCCRRNSTYCMVTLVSPFGLPAMATIFMVRLPRPRKDERMAQIPVADPRGPSWLLIAFQTIAGAP